MKTQGLVKRASYFMAKIYGILSTVCAVIVVSNSVASATEYKLTILNTQGGASRAYAINNSGQVVGFFPVSNGETHAFLYSNGTMNDLGNMGGTRSDALDINDSGQIVGLYFIGGEQHAYLYSKGTKTDIGTLGGKNSVAWSINDAGNVVGYSTTAAGEPNSHAFLYGNKTMTDLGTLGGNRSEAWDSNDSGQIVGYSLTASGLQHAFLYSNGTMTDLGTLGGTRSGAQGINGSGQIVGYSSTASGLQHAFLYSNGTMTDLGTLGGNSSTATGINNLGQVVGMSITASGEQHAFLYSNGTMTDLDISSSLPRRFQINDAGQIVGTALINGLETAILLTPIDTTPPVINSLLPDKAILWPANHQMVTVKILTQVSDDSGKPVNLRVSVTSNEPQDGLGDGDKSPDWTAPVTDNGIITLQLRAERSGKGNSRTYTVKIVAVDEAGNASSEEIVNILVPHDKGK